MYKAAVLALALVATVAHAKNFDPRTYGAKADGTTRDTVAIQKALDAAGKARGSTVVLSGGTFLSGALELRSHTTLRIETGSTLLATDDPADFPPITELRSPARKPLLSATKAEDITITGGGTVDGHGARWWKEARAQGDHGIVGEGYLRPRLIVLSECKHVRIDHLTVRDSPFWQIVPYYCDDITLSDLVITADPHSPNTDAIDPFSSSHILIERVVADVGDDNIAIKSGVINSPGPDAPSRDIVIRDCTFRHGHGVSIGSEISGGVQNVTVERVHFDGTDNGIRIKSNRDRGHDVSNIRVRDIDMKNVKVALLLSEYYPATVQPPGNAPAPIGRLTPFFHDIRIENVRSTAGRTAGYIFGLPESPIKDLLLRNVTLEAEVGLTVGNAEVRTDHLEVHATKGQPITQLEGAHLQPVK